MAKKCAENFENDTTGDIVKVCWDCPKHVHNAAFITEVEKRLAATYGDTWSVRANSYRSNLNSCPAGSVPYSDLNEPAAPKSKKMATKKKAKTATKTTQFEGILIRATKTDTGKLPRSGDVSDAIDVIPYGATQASNPSNLFLNTSWNKDFNVEFDANKRAYIYVRGINTDDDFLQKDCYLYFAKDSDLDTPDLWSSNTLKTASGAACFEFTAQQENSKVVTTDPFTWTPPTVEDDESYSLIAINVEPGATPDFSGVKGDWESFVDNNGNVGWKKVTIKNATPVIPPLQWSTSLHYAQGETEREMHFTVNTSEIPIGSYVSFSSVADTGSTGTPSNPINLPKTKVTTSPTFTTGLISDVPAGYACTITFNLYADNPASGSSVAFVASYTPSSEGSGPVRPVTVEYVKTTNS